MRNNKPKQTLTRLGRRRLYAHKKPNQAFMALNSNTKIRHGVSKLESEILNYIPEAERSVLIRGFNNKIYIVDGYIRPRREIIEILGDFYHGNLTKYKPDQLNTLCKKTMLQLYNETRERFAMFHSMGYKIRFVWEKDWKTKRSLGRYYTGPNDNLF
jgi:hypothetical protein